MSLPIYTIIMPRTYRRKTRPRRRRRKTKRRNTRTSLGGVITGPSANAWPLGKKFKCRMRYNTSAILDAPLGGLLTDYVIRANSVFDPDFTGVGSQPVGFDQMAAFYDHYTVIGAVIRATFLNQDSNDPQTVGIYVADVGTSEANRNKILSNPNCRFTTLGGAASNRGVSTIVYKLNPNKFLGIGSPISNPNTRPQTTTNPTEQCFFHLFSAGIDGAANPSNVLVNITIDYTVVFTEPKKLDLS